MAGADNKPPASVPNKAKYMQHDLHRLRQFFDVPLNRPSDFGGTILGKGTLQAMRFVTAVDMKHPELVEDLSRELWMRIWSRDEDITTPDSFKAAGKKAGLSDAVIDDALGRIKSQEVKDRLKSATDEALGYGAFGAPTIIAHLDNGPELLFGSDRFDILAMLLGEHWKGPIPSGSKARL